MTAVVNVSSSSTCNGACAVAVGFRDDVFYLFDLNLLDFIIEVFRPWGYTHCEPAPCVCALASPWRVVHWLCVR